MGPGPYFHHCLHLHNLLLLFTLFCSHHYYFHLVFLFFVNNKTGGIENPSVLVGSKVIFCCVQVHVNLVSIRQTSGAVDTYLFLLESARDKPRVSLLRETCCWLLIKLPLGVTNADHYFSAIKQLSGVIAEDSSLQDRGVAHYLLPLLLSC